MFSPWNASSSCNLLLSKPITLPDLKFSKGSVLPVVSSDLMAIWPSDIGRPFKHLISKCPHCFARSLVIWPDPQPTSTTCCGSPAWDTYKNSHSKIITHTYFCHLVVVKVQMHLLMEWVIHLTDVEGLTEALNVGGKVLSLSTSCCSQLCGRLRIGTFVCLFFTSESLTHFHHFTRWQMKDKRSDGEPSFHTNCWGELIFHTTWKRSKKHTLA